jgi:hypothetical protein
MATEAEGNHVPKVGQACRKALGRPAEQSRIAYAASVTPPAALPLTDKPLRSTVKHWNGSYLGDVG